MLSQVSNSIQWNAQTLTIVMVFGIPLVSIIGGMWYAFEKMRSENELKRTMVQRGMSVDEIERVLTMRPGKKTP